MEVIILSLHVVLAVLIVILVLMQQGKGAGMGASFGSGSSNTVFGSSGNWSFFAKVTSGAVALFFVTSLILAWIAQQEHHGQSSDVGKLLQTIEENAAGSAEEDVLPSFGAEEQPEQQSQQPDASQ